MKKQLFAVFCLSLAVLLFGCGRVGGRVLHIYHWEGYINPDLITKFEQQFKCKVESDIFGSLEELSVNVAKGEKKYDIVFPASSTARELYADRLIQDIDHSKIPNLKNIDLDLIARSNDSPMKYSVPYTILFTGIAYNKNKIKNIRPTWAVFGRPDLAGKTALLDDEREVLGAASKMLGYSYNASDDIQLRKAANIVLAWKRNNAAFGDNRDLEEGLISGKYDLIQDYSGDALNLIKTHPEIDFVLPQEGTSINVDTFVIPRASANTELAYDFINFFLDAEIGKENMLYILYLTPNLAARELLPKEFLSNAIINPPKSVFSKSEYIRFLSKDEEKYRVLWGTIAPSE